MKVIGWLLIFLFSYPHIIAQQNATIDSLTKVLKTSKGKYKVDTYNRLAQEYAAKSDSVKTYEMTEKAMTLAKTTDYPNAIATANYYRGVVNMRIGKLKEARQFFEKSLKLSKTNNHYRGLANAYIGLGNIQKYTNQFSEALKFYELGLQNATKVDYNQAIFQAYSNMANVYQAQGQSEPALNILQKSLKLSTTLNNQKIIGKVYHQMGQTYQKAGKLGLALEHYYKSLKIDQKAGQREGMASSYNNIGNVYELQGKYAKSLDAYFKALAIDSVLQNKEGIAYDYGNIGIIYDEQGKYSKALEYYFKSLKILQELKDQVGIAINYNNIGDIYLSQKNLEKAEEYYLKSARLKEKVGYQRGAAFSYTNLALVYKEKKKYAQALEYLQKAVNIRTAIGDKSGLASCHEGIGDVLLEQKQYVKARAEYEKAYSFRKQIGEKNWTAQALVKLGEVDYYLQKYPQALKSLKEAIATAQSTGNPAIVKQGAEVITKVYQQMGDFKNAFQSHVLFKQMSDSLFNEGQTKNLTRAEADFEFQKEKDSLNFVQEKEKAILNTKIEKEQFEKRMYRNVNWLVIGLLLLITLFAFTFFRGRQRQKRLNTQLTKQSNDLKQQQEKLIKLNQEVQESNAEITAANEEINSINETLQDTVKTVERQRDDILSSINYAKRIQTAMLPFEERLKEALPEHFVIFQPRDVVSGDFYWFEEVDGRQIIVVGDCTGHGVPGAFMTMLGSQALSNIVLQRNITKPDQILNALDEELPYLLKTSETQVDDGMDVVVVMIDKAAKKLHFAGAKNSLVLLQNGALNEVKGDTFSINGQRRGNQVSVKFTPHTFDIDRPTTFYMYSDGYQDQFGGLQGKKFMKRQLRELILKLSTQPISQQKITLETTFNDWMGARSQTDDVLVMGVKL